MESKKLAVYAFPAIVLLILLALGQGLGKGSINSSFALASVVVLGVTFIIGPLSRFSGSVNRLKIHRKYLGLSAFALLLVHVLMAFGISYGFDLGRLLSLDNPRMLQVYCGVIGFLIFFLMTLTSNTSAIRMMGPRNWKLLHNTGYVAMALSMLHFMLANTDSPGVLHLQRAHVLLILILGIMVILARVLVFALVLLEGFSKRR